MNHGRLLPEELFYSKSLGTKRVVRVYLPPSYEASRRKRYPVLYVHDGQNVFSSAGPGACFGWGPWNLDITADDLAAKKKMREIIIVAIDNGRSRYQEYRGPSDAPNRYEDYAAFLIRELKPWLDREFRTLPKPATTGVLGSSLGGICSVALAWDYPKVFGLAGSMSGSFQIERRRFLRKVLGTYARRRKPIRIYIDSGVIDHDGDDDGQKDNAEVVAQLRRIGWKEGINLKHYVEQRTFNDQEMAQAGLPHHKWHEAQQSQHNEFYWRMRAWRALSFLFPPPAKRHS